MVKNKYFESQADDEEVKLILRRHWFVLVPTLAVVIVLYAIGFLLLFILPLFLSGLVLGELYNFYVLSMSLIFLVATNVLFSAILIYYLNVGLITNEHIVEILQERLFSRKVSVLELGRIQDVSSSQKGIIQTFLNFGQVGIQTAGELPNFTFTNIPDPGGCAHTIMNLINEYAEAHGEDSSLGKLSSKPEQAEK